ncbi:DUF4833 domain-containing protein [Corallococcus aberystwythensis]|uniref:DUF4833 domain-containing protein n=1 Tax=Corallococcus aberystwythensis TaxID=2316722 RepID=A0A3A8PI99_9BACT|nr:DUF4833 domain-containing protein [Corallococcus aberystwythensis]RKH56067.1 DUF4833 domain-containing protein [Corallococcus aberystwythensis]
MFPESGLSHLAAIALTTVGTLASAAGASLPSQSAFFLSRSENRNQVHYALRLDEACRPVGTQPVQVYWRMLERGPSEVEELLGVEQPVYGLEDPQTVEATTEGGWRVRVRLRAFPSRPIDITTARVDGKCQVQAWTKLGNSVSRLEHVFVKTSWPFSVDFVRLDGVGSDGQPVHDLIRQ